MATKTYYAKLNCISNPPNKENLANEQYKNICDFMSYLTGSGVADLVSWNSGSGAVSGSFDTRTYWDGARPFGAGAHSLWRMKANAERPWDWYLYLQLVIGSQVVNAQTFNQPIVYYSSTVAPGDGRTILVQTAVCFSGSTSFNPWNGAISDGNSTAADPRWVSGSNDRTMYVLPRSNDLGGSHTASRNNSIRFTYVPSVGSTRQTTCHYIYDGDSFYCGTDIDLSRTIDIGYFGSFDLHSGLSGSGICGGTKGFVMYSCLDTSATFFTNTEFGRVDGGGGAGSSQGGVGVPIGIMVSGSRAGRLELIGNFPTTAYQPNPLLKGNDEFPIFVGVNESPYFGYLGNLNSGLIKGVIGLQSYTTTQDLSRAIVGGNLVPSNRKISIPWTGSFGPGYIKSPREGFTYTWTRDYG
jgi:hypothetical protein